MMTTMKDRPNQRRAFRLTKKMRERVGGRKKKMALIRGRERDLERFWKKCKRSNKEESEIKDGRERERERKRESGPDEAE